MGTFRRLSQFDNDELLPSLMNQGLSVVAESHRERIVAVAGELLSAGGRDAVSTRAVSAAAGVQAPTIYRIFGDMHGLLQAVAAEGYSSYIETNDVDAGLEPIDELRAGWDLHVAFGLANPYLYSLIYGAPESGERSPAAIAAAELIAGHVHRIARAGQLRISEKPATELVHALERGTTLTLIAASRERRNGPLSKLARESVIAAMTTASPAATDHASAAHVSSAHVSPAHVSPAQVSLDPVWDDHGAADHGVAGAASTLRAALSNASVLSNQETALMLEWLDRITNEG